MFPTPVQARYIRIIPQEWEKAIALRLELIGCAPPTKNTPSTPTGPVGVVTMTPPSGRVPSKDSSNMPPTGPVGVDTMTPPSGRVPSRGTDGMPPTGPVAVVTMTPPIVQAPYCNNWSKFYNLDSPHTGTGDIESIKALINKENFCNKPGEVVTGVNCQMSDTGAIWTSGAQTNVVCDVKVS